MSRLMTLSRYFLPLAIFLIIVFFLWRGLKEDPTQIPSPLIGKPVPAFSGPELGNSAQRITNQQFLGHVSLLNVWASWCLSCQAEHSVLMEIADTHTVTLIGLNYKDQSANALAWLEKAGDPYSLIISDPEGKLGINLGVYGTPETFLIDQKGIIRYKYIGPISPEVWQDDILPRVQKLAG